MTSGIDCLLEGLGLITKPGLRRYVVIPLLINIVLLTLAAIWGVSKYSAWTAAISSYLPSWLEFLSSVISLIAALLVVVVVLYLFTIVASIIAAPFNAVLSEKVEERLTGRPPISESALHVLVVRAFWREISKVFYYLKLLLILVVITLIPGINIVSPALWLAFGAWMLAVEYCDYAADNNEVPLKELRRRLGRSRAQALAFGILAYLMLAIPLLNLVLIPAAVAGGTVFWVRRLAPLAEGD